MLHHEKSKQTMLLMVVTLVMILWTPEVHCIVESLNILDDVLRFTQNGSPVRVPIQQVALGSNGAILWAAAQDGVLYQINATTMAYINSTTLATTVGFASGLFVDDTFGRVYACYAASAGVNAISVFLINSATLAQVTTACTFNPSGSTPNLFATQHFYDPLSRKLASITYFSNTGSFIGYHAITVASDSCSAVDFTIHTQLTSITGVQYTNSTDSLVMWTYTQSQNGQWLQQLLFFSAISSESGSFSATTIDSAPPFGGSVSPPFAGTASGGNLEYLSGPMTFTSTYDYAVYISSTVPSNGSAVVQYANPVTSASPYTPKGMVTFPTEPTMLAISLDETAISSTAGVIFISTTDGQLKKYRYSDDGTNPMAVTTPNYNSGTFIDSPPPYISSQVYSKTTQSIYLASGTTAGGVWRVPFHSCHTATSCTTCIALNDPYCGWCPLGNLCGTLSICSTGIREFLFCCT